MGAGEIPLKPIVEDVAKRFPEVNLNRWTVEAQFGFAGRKPSFVKAYRFQDSLHLRIIINRHLKHLSHDALSALVAHELAHIVLHESKKKKSEKDVSIEAVSRGFGDNFRRLFAELCPRRMYHMEHAECKTQIGGLNCAEFCPFYGDQGRLNAPP